MRYGLILGLSICTLLAKSSVDITAVSFFANEKEAIFDGNVTIKRLKDTIKTSKVIVSFDKNHQPIHYEAPRRVKIFFNNGKTTYKGAADRAIFYPLKETFELIGHAKVEQSPQGRVLQGDKIVFDRKNDSAKVEGSQKHPVTFSFSIDEK
jgi:lipopolysaccharide export system protein LptA